MSAIIELLIGPIGGFIIGAIGIAGAFLWAKKKGAAGERAKREKIDRAAVAKRDEIDDAVAGRTPDENRGRLGKWSRP